MFQLSRIFDRRLVIVRVLECPMTSVEEWHDDPDEAAERYLLKEMPADESRAYSLHLLSCAPCVQTVKENCEFICAMLDTPREFLSEEPDEIEHSGDPIGHSDRCS